MIKSLTVWRQVESKQRFEELSEFLRSIGFEEGAGWRDEHSSGAANVAASGNLEFVHGRAPAEPEVLVEVTDLDSVHRAATKKFGNFTGEITATHWKSRVFVLQVGNQDPSTRVSRAGK